MQDADNRKRAARNRWAVALSLLAVIAAFLVYAAVIHHRHFSGFVIASYAISALALGFSLVRGVAARPRRILRLAAITTLLLTWSISGYESPDGVGYRPAHHAGLDRE
jgi:hypothetical protein